MLRFSKAAICWKSRYHQTVMTAGPHLLTPHLQVEVEAKVAETRLFSFILVYAYSVLMPVLAQIMNRVILVLKKTCSQSWMEKMQHVLIFLSFIQHGQLTIQINTGQKFKLRAKTPGLTIWPLASA